MYEVEVAGFYCTEFHRGQVDLAETDDDQSRRKIQCCLSNWRLSDFITLPSIKTRQAQVYHSATWISDHTGHYPRDSRGPTGHYQQGTIFLFSKHVPPCYSVKQTLQVLGISIDRCQPIKPLGVELFFQSR